MAEAKVVKTDIEIELKLSGDEARVLFDIVAEHVFGAGRDENTSKIYDALVPYKRDLPARRFHVKGRLDIYSPVDNGDVEEDEGR